MASLISILERQDGEALLQAILDSGSGVDLADPLGRTLLMHAVHFAGIYDSTERDKMLSGITCLLRHGADANLRDTPRRDSAQRCTEPADAVKTEPEVAAEETKQEDTLNPAPAGETAPETPKAEEAPVADEAKSEDGAAPEAEKVEVKPEANPEDAGAENRTAEGQ